MNKRKNISGKSKMRNPYDNIAEDYARFRHSDPNAVERLIQGSGISSDSIVLEIGCGTGNYISAIQARVGCVCFGIDPSRKMINQAKKRDNGVTYSVSSAENLKFAAGFFDFVFSVDVIHHVGDRIRYFLQAYRVLRPGGLLATLTDSEETIRQRAPLTFYFPDTVEPELERYPNIDEMKQYACEVGFQLEGEEVVETPYALDNIESYRRKTFSCLNLISEESFKMGIERMEKDLEAGPIQCVPRHFVLWNRK
jgi:ubiquinone/menaquinone biosynthesis C-methylase UbiE